MTLDKYLKDKSIKEFSALLDVDQATVWRWRHGHRFPNKEMITKIQEITGDAVRAEDWYV